MGANTAYITPCLSIFGVKSRFCSFYTGVMRVLKYEFTPFAPVYGSIGG